MPKNNGEKTKGAVMSYLNNGISIGIGLIYTPFMIKMLGQHEYGLYNLVLSVVSYLSLLDLGFASAYTRFFQRARVTQNKKNANQINAIFQMIFAVIAVCTIICGAFLVFNIQYVIGAKISNQEVSTAKILMIFMVANIAFNFLFCIYNAYIYAHEKFVWQQILNLIINILNPVIMIPLLFYGYKSVALAVVAFLLTLLRGLINLYIAKKKLHMQFDYSGLKLEKFKEVFSFSAWVFLYMIAGQLTWNVDNIVLGHIVGTSAVAIYSVGMTFYRYYNDFSVTIYNVLIPEIYKLNSKENANQLLIELMLKAGRIQFMILALICTGFICFGKWFVLNIYAGEAYTESYYVGIILLIGTLTPLIQNVGQEIQRAKGKQQFGTVVKFAIAILNVLISIPLGFCYGAVGCALGTLITTVVGDGVIMNCYYHKFFGLDMLYYWKGILKMIPGVVISFIPGFIMSRFVENIISFGICIVIYCLVYVVVMYKFSMNDYEKMRVKRIVHLH